MGGFLNEGLRDWIAVGGIALALLQTFLAVRAVGGESKGIYGAVPSPRRSQAEPDVRTPYELRRAAEDEKALRDSGSQGVFSLVASAFGLAVGIAITYAVARGHITLSMKAFSWLLAACSLVFVGGAIFGVYGVWFWSEGRSASKHLRVASLVRASIVGLTITTAGALWWCLGENRDAWIAGGLRNFVMAAFVLLLASAVVFVNPKS